MSDDTVDLLDTQKCRSNEVPSELLQNITNSIKGIVTSTFNHMTPKTVPITRKKKKKK